MCYNTLLILFAHDSVLSMEVRTAELLEGMTDAAKFERLATLVLRKADPRFQAIMHLGINARGQPIAAPNDGFCQVPDSDPPTFLWVQHTVERRESLRGKWLSEDDAAPGDLLKAAREADTLRAQFPTAKFIVILSTNQRLPTEKKKKLAQDIYTAAHTKGLEAIIWEQSQYRDFLDSDRDGQWFRKEFFGIDAAWLSEPLLAVLSQKSLAAYAQRQFTDPASWVARQLDERLRLHSEDHPWTIKLILGESGFGKTAAAYRFLQRHIETGGYGLYLSERTVEQAISLEDALRQTLQQLYPSLLSSEVDTIPTHLPAGSPFVIVVDDVNQTRNPPEVIRKLVGWSREPYVMICPTWPRFWKPTQAVNIKANVDVVSIDRMPFDEAISAVQRVVERAARPVTAIDARMIADSLRGDPLLIGTFGELLHRDPQADMLALARNAVETYIEQYVADAANASQNHYFVPEYYEALASLTGTMLHRKSLYPSWSQVAAWLQNTPTWVSVLRDLASHGKICQVSDTGEFRFQHDRFLEYFSVRALGPMFAQLVECQDVLTEPYYAEIIGQALVTYPQSEAILDEMLRLHPLALAFSVRAIGIPTTDYHHTIVQKVQDWVQSAGSSSRTPETLRGAVANCFINTDSPAVLDIVHTNFRLEVSWLGDMARLRNGDLESGVRLFTRVGADYRKDGFVTELVDHAKRYHGEHLRTELLRSLSTVMEEGSFKGTMIFAGYLAFPDLQAAIVAAWQQQSNHAQHLACVMWAVLRCSGTEQDSVHLDTFMAYWAEMPDVEEGHRAGYQHHIADGMRRLVSNQADVSVVQYLIDQAQKRPRLREAIPHLCGSIDQPQSIDFSVRQAALQEDWSTSPLTMWALFDNPPLSSASVAWLQKMWASQENGDAVRQVAFRLWLDNVDREAVEVLPLIQPIPAESPLYLRAVQERAFLGDITSVPALLEQLELHPHLLRVVPPVWNADLKQAVSVRLRSCSAIIPVDFSGGLLDEHFLLAAVLTNIPEADAEALLIEHWPHLRYSPLFVEAAVFVGTPRTLARVDEILAAYPPDIDPFRYLDTIYRFNERSRESWLRLVHLQHLEPYIDRLSDHTQSSCAGFCYRQGGTFVNWCMQHLPQEMNDRYRVRYPQTEEDILRQLDAHFGHPQNHALSVLEQFQKQNDPVKFLDILRRWLEHQPTWQKVEAAAYCIERIGSRADVAMLDIPLQYAWEQHHIKVVQESTLFGVCRRTLS